MIDKLLFKLEAERNQAAKDLACRKPAEGTDMSYFLGRGQGYYAGLEKALEILNVILKDKDERDFNL